MFYSYRNQSTDFIWNQMYVVILTSRLVWNGLIISKQWPEVFCEKVVLKYFANFTAKDLCWILFLIKLQASNLLKRDSNTDRL